MDAIRVNECNKSIPLFETKYQQNKNQNQKYQTGDMHVRLPIFPQMHSL